MSKLPLQIFLLVAVAAFSGCALFHKKKKDASSAHIYEGDSPSIRFTDRPEKPGGEVYPY